MKLLDGFKFLLNPSWLVNNFFTLWGGDGGGSSAPTQSNVVNTNIPDYAQPYVENMLNATQAQLFNVDKNGNLSSLKPYTPYSANMNDYVSPFSPLQQQAQAKTANLSMPGQFGAGSNLALQSGVNSGQIGRQATQAGNQYNQMATNPYATQAFMNPYVQASLAPTLQEMQRQYGITGANEQSAATRAGAFGGSREALMAAENERNKNMAMNQAIGQGYNNAFQNAQQAQQFGANLGLQGLQTGLTGMGQAGQAGATLGQLGSSQLGAAQGIINTQNQIGQQQQAQEQQKVNQAIQNYATAQQYPLMELGTMSNMLRGLPMQASTTQQYQAAPSALTQGIGIAGALGSLGQSGIFGGKKEGGMVNSYAEGGIASYDVGGAVKADLERMPTEKLKQLENSAKGIELSQIKQILSEREQGAMPEFAPGGIVAFKKGEVVDSDVASAKYDAFQAETNPAVDAGFKALFPPSLMMTDNVIKSGLKDALRYPFKGTVAGVDENGKFVTREEKYGKTPYLDEFYKNREANLSEKNANVQKLQEEAANQKAINAQRTNLTGSALPKDAINTSGNPLQYNYNDPTAALINTAGPSMQSETTKPAATAAKTIVDPSKSILNTPKDSQNPAFTMEAMQKYGEDAKQKADQAYLDNVKNAPMSPEGQKLYDSYENKVKNAKTKEEQRMWMHSALFFARLGSTPGSIGVAALSALKEQLPEYIKDKDALEEYQDKTQKAMYDISNAEMLKRQGRVEAGEKAKNEALKNYSDYFIHNATIEHNKLTGKAAYTAATKEPSELTTLKGINANQDLKDLYLGKSKQKDIDTAYAAYLKSHEGETDVMTRSQFEQTHYTKGDTLYPGFTDKTNYKG